MIDTQAMVLSFVILISLCIAALNVAERRRRAKMTPRERQEEDCELQLW